MINNCTYDRHDANLLAHINNFSCLLFCTPVWNLHSSIYARVMLSCLSIKAAKHRRPADACSMLIGWVKLWSKRNGAISIITSSTMRLNIFEINDYALSALCGRAMWQYVFFYFIYSFTELNFQAIYNNNSGLCMQIWWWWYNRRAVITLCTLLELSTTSHSLPEKTITISPIL